MLKLREKKRVGGGDTVIQTEKERHIIIRIETNELNLNQTTLLIIVDISVFSFPLTSLLRPTIICSRKSPKVLSLYKFYQHYTYMNFIFINNNTIISIIYYLPSFIWFDG